MNPKITVGAVFVVAMFMHIMDATIVNVALPTLSGEFGVSAAAAGATVTGYLVSLAISIPASGWLGDRFGTKRVFLVALAVFTLASALCGFAGGLAELVAFRVLQGIGGGMLTPVGTAMLFRTFPQAERIRAIRILIVPTVVAPAVGPVLGGLLVDQLTWRWVFYVNVPIGIAAFVFGLVLLREHREPSAGRFDLSGFVLAGAGLGSVMYALSEGPRLGWASGLILASGLGGAAGLALLVLVELRAAAPMLHLRLFGNRLFRTAGLVVTAATAGFIGTLFLVPLFVQEALGMSALSSGLLTFPEALGVMTATQVVSRVYPRVGPRRLMVGGLAFMSVTVALMSTVSAAVAPWAMPILMFLTGAGVAHAFAPGQTAALATISMAATGQASTLFNAQRQLGAALGVALVSTVLAVLGTASVTAAGGPAPSLTAYHIAFLSTAGLALVGSLIALWVPDRDAAPTMAPSGKAHDPPTGPAAAERLST